MTNDSTSLPYLRTKLHRPLIPRDHVRRPRLLAYLDQRRELPLTLVSAPAGYGKSILTSCWLETSDFPGAWLSLDEQDNDLRQFLFGFLAAVQSIFPEAVREAQVMVSAPNLPPLQVLSTVLINDLDRIEEDFVLVLDDFHAIHEDSVHAFLREVLRHPPQPMHLVLISRKDPFLPISNLRARDQVTEVRTHDLRFTESEAKEFLKFALGDRFEDTTAIELSKKTEGWVTGLRLAVLAMGGPDNSVRKLLDLKGTTAYVMDYLMTEVLNAQSPIIRQYLLRSSILDRFCASLCEVLCGPDCEPGESGINGAEFIKRLQKDNLFQISLDSENRWFRYHHLFKSLLQSRLERQASAEDITGLHSRASKWFEAEGLVSEAVQHALDGGDIIAAARLMEQNRQSMLNSDRWFFFEKRLPKIPDSVIQKRPELLLAQVWVHYFHNRFALIPPILDVIESLLSDEPKEQPLYGEIYLFNGVICFMQGDGLNSLKYIEKALDRIPESHDMVRGFAEIYLGLAGQMQGQASRVVEVLSNLIDDPSLVLSRRTRALTALVWIHVISGDLSVAASLNRQLQDVAFNNDAATFSSWGSYNQGIIHFQRNELDAAIHHLRRAEKTAYLMLRRASADCIAGLALAYQAKGQVDQAGATLERLFELIRPFNDPALLDLAYSCEARLSLMKGGAASACNLSGINKTMNTSAMIIWLEVPVITQCRVLLSRGSNDDLREAEKTLQDYLRLNQEHHNTLQMIWILGLLALTIHRQGRLEKSLDVLEQAVVLAAPGGIIRPFVELGPVMADLLKRLLEKAVAPDHIKNILSDFEGVKPVTVPGESAHDIPSPSIPAPQPLVEPLSNRESEVLDLLAERLQNKEIAEKLFVSPHTVRTHLKNIYQKLDVGSRRQAVVRAMDLGILPSRLK